MSTTTKPQSIYVDEKENKSIFINDDIESFIPSNSIFKQPQDESKSIRERSLIFFKNVIGNDEIKEALFRSLLQDDRTINTILVGPPATSKSLLLKQIENGCNKVLWYDCASGSTSSGLIEMLRRNQDTKILILDEISEMKRTDIDVLRSILNDGRVSKTLKSQFINFKMKGLRIYATTNNPTKLSIPIKSRFQMYLIDPYNDTEYVQVLTFCLLQQKIVENEQMAKELSWAMLHYGIKNIRTALSVCSLIHRNDSHDDIKRIIENYLVFNANDCNINYNEQDAQ